MKELMRIVKSYAYHTQKDKFLSRALELAMDQLTEEQQRNICADILKEQRKEDAFNSRINERNRELLNRSSAA